MKPSNPSCLLFTELQKTQLFYLKYISITVSMCQHYHIDLVLWLMSWKLYSPHFSLHTDWPTGDLNPNNVLQASRDQKGSISFPCRALRMASFLTAPADENKGNCILKQRPSRNPHNSCCLWCKYLREVSWPHSMAKAINNHKKYEPPSQWLIACILHNALFAVSFKQFTISDQTVKVTKATSKWFLSLSL